MSILKAKRLLFVIHGARAEQAAVRRLIDIARGAGHTVSPRITWARGDATNFAFEGAREGVDAVVALGGDGTVNETVNGLSASTSHSASSRSAPPTTSPGTPASRSTLSPRWISSFPSRRRASTRGS